MNKLVKNTTIVMAATILGKLSGFLREVVLAGKYGTSPVSDAFVIAYNIPNILLSSIAGAIAIIFIPMYTKLASEDKTAAQKMVNNLVTILVAAGAALSLLFWLFPQIVVRIFAVGFQGETFVLTVSLIKTMIWSLVPILLINLFSSYLQINGRFLLPGSYSTIINTCVIVAFFLSSADYTSPLGFGMLFGFWAAALALIVQSAKQGFHYKPSFHLDENVKQVFSLFIPVFLSNTVVQISKIFDRNFASVLGEGTVSALNYASKLQEFISAVFIVSVATVVFPEISKLDKIRDTATLKGYISKSLNAISLIVVPITIGTIVLSEPLVKILFMRGAFDDAAVKLTSESLSFYAIGLLAIGYNMILSRAFYALQDTKTPAINSAIAMMLDILLNFLLLKPMAHKGLALSTSISGIVTTVFLLFSLRKKLGSLGLRFLLSELTKIIVSAISMGVVVSAVFLKVSVSFSLDSFISNTLAILLCVGIGAAEYIIMLFLFRVKLIQDTTQTLLIKMKK